MEEKIYDLIVVGGGPGGMTACVYASRAGLDVLLLEKDGIGGQTALTYEIKNYPGFVNTDGFTLTQKMLEQVQDNGVNVVMEEVCKVELDSEIKTIHTYQNQYKCKSVIFGLGAKPRKLGLAEEKQYLGKGISYCAVCDGSFFRDKVVAVVGGGNSAFEDACYLSNIAKKVYLVHRRDEFVAQDILVKELQEKAQNGNVEFVLHTQVVKAFGENNLDEIELENLVDHSHSKLQVDGLFVAVGRIADTELLTNEVEIDKFGYIVVDEKMQTKIQGVYAVGDCTQKALRQIVTACADGAIAGTNASIFVKTLKKK